MTDKLSKRENEWKPMDISGDHGTAVETRVMVVRGKLS